MEPRTSASSSFDAILKARTAPLRLSPSCHAFLDALGIRRWPIHDLAAFAKLAHVSELGSGAFGVAFLLDSASRKFVVKQCHTDYHFQAEVLALCALRGKDRVQRLVGVSLETQQPFLITEYAGPTLAKVKSQLNLRQRQAVFHQLQDAVRGVHCWNYIHADIKDLNVCVRVLPDGGVSVTLIDFGCAYSSEGYVGANPDDKRLRLIREDLGVDGHDAV